MIFRDFLPMNVSSGEHTLLSTATLLYIKASLMSTQNTFFLIKLCLSTAKHRRYHTYKLVRIYLIQY